MKMLNERQFFERNASRTSKLYATVFGIACLLFGACSFGSLTGNDFTALIPVAFYLTIGILLLAMWKWAVSLAGTVYLFANMIFFAQVVSSSSMSGQTTYGVGHNFFIQTLASWIDGGSWYSTSALRYTLAICIFACLAMLVLGTLATMELYKCSKSYLTYLVNEETPLSEDGE